MRPGVSGLWRGMGALRRHLLGLVLVTHPLPSAMYVVVMGLCAVVAAASAHLRLDLASVARVLVAVACAEVATGAMNDYCDRALDAASNRAKPIVRGLIAPAEALALAAVASVVMVSVVLPLGVVPLAFLLVIEGLGLAYDLRFKGTPVSALLFALYFPLFPLLAWLLFGRWEPFLPWLVPMGAALGVAMNVVNTLPDLEADVAHGMRGLPHLLGLRRGLLIAWGTPPAVLVGIWALYLTGAVPARLAPLLVATAAGLLSVLAAMLLYRRRPAPSTLRLTFIVQALGIVGLAAGWLAAVAF